MKTLRLTKLIAGFACIAMLALTAPMSALAMGHTTIFNLSNHPDGSEQPPTYGMRLDELFNVSGSHDVFTFDFNHALSSVQLTLNTNTLTARIAGQVWGGLDTGSSYGNPLYVGLWNLDFTYGNNIALLPSGGFVVTAEDQVNNNGTITPLFDVGGMNANNGTPIALWDEQGSHSYSYRFDTNNHRLGGTSLNGSGVFVGDGWMNHGGNGNTNPNYHITASDWLHVGTPVPEPSTILLLSSGIIGMMVWHRRRSQVKE